jgi:hypothetical protein
MNENISKYLIIFGILSIIAGLLYYFFGSKLQFLGNLPGDLKIQKGNFKIYFPITTMLLLSLCLNLILFLIKKLF